MSAIEGLTFAADIIIDQGIDGGMSFFEDAGWRRLDEGLVATTRHAFETNRDTVVKVPQRDGYERINKQEVEGWEMCADESLIAPVVDHGPEYKWIEMVKCHRVNRSDTSIRKAYEAKLGESIYTIPDLHLDNLGLHPDTKEIVCYDYPRIERNP